MSIMSIRGASARPMGSSIIAGVWSGDYLGSASADPDIPGAVEMIAVVANRLSVPPPSGLTVLHLSDYGYVAHGPLQSIRVTSRTTSTAAVAVIGFTRPITPTVVPEGTYPGLTTVCDYATTPSAANLPGVQWEAAASRIRSNRAVVSALALVDSPHTWVIPGADQPAVTTITW